MDGAAINNNPKDREKKKFPVIIKDLMIGKCERPDGAL
jgi:hypothetical protein